ncbi:MAG: hypothetical protein R3F03_00370 [Opitutaceae bacterium]
MVVCLFQLFIGVIIYRDSGFSDTKAWLGWALVFFGFGSFVIHDFATRKKRESWLASPEVTELTRRYQSLVPIGEDECAIQEILQKHMKLDRIGTGFLRIPQLGFRKVRVITFSDAEVEMLVYTFKNRVVSSEVRPK